MYAFIVIIYLCIIIIIIISVFFYFVFVLLIHIPLLPLPLLLYGSLLPCPQYIHMYTCTHTHRHAHKVTKCNLQVPLHFSCLLLYVVSVTPVSHYVLSVFVYVVCLKKKNFFSVHLFLLSSLPPHTL